MKERQLVNQARNKGLIAGRTAGSHTPFDLFTIDQKNKTITFVQVKNKKVYGKEKQELKKLEQLTGTYQVKFEAWTK